MCSCVVILRSLSRSSCDCEASAARASAAAASAKRSWAEGAPARAEAAAQLRRTARETGVALERGAPQLVSHHLPLPRTLAAFVRRGLQQGADLGLLLPLSASDALALAEHPLRFQLLPLQLLPPL